MCGIVGFTGNKDFIKLRRLLALLEHRGRDETTLWWDEGVNLGINRLAVNDLRPGLYPLKYKRYVLVYNGEIYNYQEIKKHLAERGVRLVSHCDGEVILPLFDLYGSAAFERLEGMFAIAIVDLNERRLILARDKMGEKPLYYSRSGENFIFASEMKAILKGTPNSWSVNPASLPEYLQQGFVFGPKTIVRGIKKLLPAQVIALDLKTNKLSQARYWRLKLNQNTHEESIENLVSRLEDELDRSVRQRLLSDVAVGCFLSGGVDSGLVAYFAGKYQKKLKTFSISFPSSPDDDESKYSQAMAAQLSADHQEIEFTQESCLPIVENIGKTIDEPISDPAALPTFLLSKLASKSVKVVLTGDGGDEVFGGYDRYRKQLLAEKLKVLGLLPPLHRRYSTQGIWREDELKRLLRIPSPPLKFPSALKRLENINPLLAMQLTDFNGYLPEQLLMKVDKMTMSHTLEARAPLLDSRLVEFGLNLPNRLKIHRGHGKFLLKKVGEKFLPKSLVWRPKHGFTLPINLWLREKFRPLAEDSAAIGESSTLFDRQTYQRILADHLIGGCDYGDKIWSMLVLTRWAKEYGISL